MAYRIEKNQEGQQEIVIDGWEKGISPSPHFGVANIQGGNISTELGEVLASFNRTNQLTSSGVTPVSGTLTASSGDGNYVLASDTALSVGQWINVTAATVQVPKTSETVSYLVVGGGGGGGGTSGNNSGGGGGGAGQLTTSSLSVAVKSYAITVGTGGAGGVGSTPTNGAAGTSSTITHTTAATFVTDVTAIGGAGGANVSAAGGVNGVSGASGSGGGGGSSGGGTGGTGTAGSNGGNGTSTTGGGGGGATSVGGNASGGTGGNGGAGTASSISGSSVTYAGGGGGGSGNGTPTGGTGGAGGGGAGGAGVDGTAATANRGAGGGGGGHNGIGSSSGGAGSAGIVIISYPTGNLTATGGTITTSGGNTIHTFNSSGTFAITAINTTQNMSTGLYFVDYSAAGPKVKIANSYDPTGANPLYHGTTGTISFTTLGQFGKPIAQATETYNTPTASYHRYYVLDNTGLVWVNDTANSVGWVLTNTSTTYYGTQAAPSGLAVLNGWLLVFTGELIYTKQTSNLGAAWTNVNNDVYENNIGTSTIPHFAYVGHQGRCYYTDGNYIGSIFPDTSLQTGTANIQSYCAYSAADTSSGTVSAILSGSGPQVPFGSSYKIPAVFSTDAFGTLPTGITANAVYWIANYVASTGLFVVYGEADSTALTLTGSPASGDTSATLTSSWTGFTKIEPVKFSNNDVRNVQFTSGSTAITWATGLSGAATTDITLGISIIDLQTGATGNQYFNTFSPIGGDASIGGTTATVTLSNQRLNLPTFEIAKCMVEIGNTLLIGCAGNVIYPWNQVDATPSGIITLPESDVVSLLTVNQMAYIFAGHRGNIYITDGSVASQITKVSDYVAGVPGSPATYIEPYYTWGGTMYLRGRVYFSILDQTASKTGNCGGVWSFVPTQNIYLGQESGVALRLENQNSYGTYNGVATLLFPRMTQGSGAPLYWSAWYSDVSTPVYGIDYSNTGTSSSFPLVIETDALPVGTMLSKKTDQQIEYKLSAPLDTGATVTAKYRTTLTGTWTSLPSFNTESTGLSGYASVNFQQAQWVQFQFTLTPITSTASTNSFVRLREVRLR